MRPPGSSDRGPCSKGPTAPDATGRASAKNKTDDGSQAGSVLTGGGALTPDVGSPADAMREPADERQLAAHGTVYSTRFPVPPAAAAFTFRGAGSASTLVVSRPARRSLALSRRDAPGSARRVAKRPVCLEGSDGFVTSTTAPIATGWSEPVAGWESSTAHTGPDAAKPPTLEKPLTGLDPAKPPTLSTRATVLITWH
jgi:hypothetical protein